MHWPAGGGGGAAPSAGGAGSDGGAGSAGGTGDGVGDGVGGSGDGVGAASGAGVGDGVGCGGSGGGAGSSYAGNNNNTIYPTKSHTNETLFKEIMLSIIFNGKYGRKTKERIVVTRRIYPRRDLIRDKITRRRVKSFDLRSSCIFQPR